MASSCSRNTVSHIKSTKFSLLSIEERLEIKRIGPDRPDLNQQQQTGRKFNTDWYTRFEWLTGCEETKRVYCFPCLLFGAASNQKAWSNGVCDWGHLSEKIKRHDMADSHINNCTKLALLGVTDIAAEMSSAGQRDRSLHNQLVDKNRYILGRIIDCIKFCGQFELALRGEDEKLDSDNPGVFLGLVNFTAGLDEVVKKHLESATVFKGTSNTIQNELLNIMFDTCQNIIRDEIRDTEFLAVISDDTTDVATQSQNVVTFRYINNGSVVERFWSFGILEKGNANSISSRILQCIDDVLPKPDDKKKLIAQCYDGANVMSGQQGGVQRIVRDKYTNAYYVHCYAHQLNLIVQQSVKSIPHMRKFFQNLGGFSAFFTRSPNRTRVLNEIVNRRIPSASSTRTWSFASRVVDTVFNHRDDLLKCLDFIIESDEFDDTSVREATGLLHFLDNPVTHVSLELFHKILIYVDQLFSSLQTKNIDTSSIQKCIADFNKGIQQVRDSDVHRIISDFQNDSGEPSPKRPRRITQTPEELSRIFLEVCDIIGHQCSERFKCSGHLIAASLFNSDNFADYNKEFPDAIMEESVKFYGFFDPKRLKVELSIIYAREDFRQCAGALALYQFFEKQNLLKVFFQASKMMKLLITIPMTSSEAERTFSTLKRVKNFLRNTMGESRLNALAMLSMERKLVARTSNFNTLVIEQFVHKKDRRAKFFYR